MPQNLSLVRASDIGAWTFCQRAWWLAQVKKAPHERPEQLTWGEASHTAHGRQLALAGRLQQIGGLLLAGGLTLLILWALWQWL